MDRTPAAGIYKQKTIRIDPDWIRAINSMAGQLHITVADAERWLIARGLQAYYRDHENPEYTQPETRTVVFPSWDSDPGSRDIRPE